MSEETGHDEADIEREVRFAVVIYGGVSLTVYINGIVQEMLNMVRSTAKSGSAGSAPLTPLQRVYRELAHLVGEPVAVKRGRYSSDAHSPRGSSKSPRQLRPGRAALRTDATERIRQRGANEAISRVAGTEPQIYTRFVVDILSGTSAGGINAIFLAKALANNLSLDSLAEMWIRQADMQLLLNDKKVDPKGLLQVPPPSLLNSRWMYLQLLTALNKMNTSDLQIRGAPLVEDLDLFCTTTDLRGMPVDIALTDETVTEQRYRNVYHFRRRTMAGDPQDHEHDFRDEMDPFLAFAARCTSSFPFAFEPMQLGDILAVVNCTKEFRGRYLRPSEQAPLQTTQTQATTTLGSAANVGAAQATQGPQETDAGEAVSLFGDKVAALKAAEQFAKICSIYQGTDIDGGFAVRPFGDGGYLDNKPFTYAIQTIKKRHALLPVDRKLIYIEPAPETLSNSAIAAKGKDTRPSAVENSLDALVVLPRYETIRQDIENVIHWNSDIARLQRVLTYLDPEMEKAGPAAGDPPGNDTYWRLRLSGATDQLGCRLAEAMNADPSSAIGEAVRSVAGTWRDRKFGDAGPNLRQNLSDLQRFLDLFDFDIRERSVRFLRARLQQETVSKEKRKNLTVLAEIGADFIALAEEPISLNLNDWQGHSGALESWDQYLAFITDPSFAAQRLQRLAEKPTDIDAMLSAEDAGRDLRVQWLFDSDDCARVLDPPQSGKKETFRDIVDRVASLVISTYGQGLAYAVANRPPLTPPEGLTKLQGISHRLEKLFAADGGSEGLFLLQDIQVYPIIFGTSLGEFEPIEVFRISPEDTRPITDTAPPGCQGNPPLKGASLDAFGAFLDQDWRMSDMLRGRLDGAERLITAVLPDSDEKTCEVRDDIIRRAQEEIAKEWVAFRDSLNLRPSDLKLKLIHELKEYQEMRGPKPKWFKCDDLEASGKEKA